MQQRLGLSEHADDAHVTVNSIAITIANAILFGGSTEQATATATMSNGMTQQGYAPDDAAVVVSPDY